MTGAGFLALLRRLERNTPHKPRIGRSRHRAGDVVQIGQDPRLDFPDSEFSQVDIPAGDRPARLRARFMGLFGAQGALPLNTTEEVLRWSAEGEDAFVRFADIFSGRFYQLFFRAWSDAHAISQHDRPQEDRFAAYLSAFAGTGTQTCRDRDSFPDIARLPLVSIFGGRVRSPMRLQQMLRQYFHLDVEVEEFIPSWLEFESDDSKGLGASAGLGRGMYLGRRVRTVNEKICIHLRIPKLEQYRDFLPRGQDYRRVADLVFWYLGRSYEVDLSLSLPCDQVSPAQLGQNAALGWLAAIAPPSGSANNHFTEIARFALEADSSARGAA